MKSNSTVSSLKYLFHIAIGVQIALFVSIAFKWVNLIPDSINISLTLERYVLLLTLVSIPGALKLFSIIMKKNKHIENKDVTNTIYTKAFIVRFGILFLVASINILLFAFSYNQNFMLCTLVTFTAYIFSYPSMNYLNVDDVIEDEESRN